MHALSVHAGTFAVRSCTLLWFDYKSNHRSVTPARARTLFSQRSFFSDHSASQISFFFTNVCAFSSCHVQKMLFIKFDAWWKRIMICIIVLCLWLGYVCALIIINNYCIFLFYSWLIFLFVRFQNDFTKTKITGDHVTEEYRILIGDIGCDNLLRLLRCKH